MNKNRKKVELKRKFLESKKNLTISPTGKYVFKVEKFDKIEKK